MTQDILGPVSHSFVSQRLRLHYLDWGNPEAPPLLLVHGGRDHARSLDWVATALRDDWHVIAPDLRGHGDSAWSMDGNYAMAAYIYDLAQLIDQLGLAPVTIVAHSLGGAVSLRYTGLYPDKVRRLVSIEGSGAMPPEFAARQARPLEERWHAWIDARRQVSARPQRRYRQLDEAIARMREANPDLSEAQVHHLAVNAVRRNEDGSYSWKYDPYIRHSPPIDMADADRERLWGRIACPTLLAWGRRSWGEDPAQDGTTALFRNARAQPFDGGHWLHHDCFDAFVATLRTFL